MIDQACLNPAMEHDSLKVEAESFMVREGKKERRKQCSKIFTWLFCLLSINNLLC